MKIYIAGPHFSETERDWRRRLKGELLKLDNDFVWSYELFNQSEAAAMSARLRMNNGRLQRCA